MGRQNPNEVELVLYHANCSDGFGSAWAAWKLLGSKAVVNLDGLPGKLEPTISGFGTISSSGLSDTPANFSGAGGKTLAVKSDASGVEFVTAASAITVQEEGSALSTAATTLNFVGANVTASGTGATKTITVSGVTVQDEGGA